MVFMSSPNTPDCVIRVNPTKIKDAIILLLEQFEKQLLGEK